MTVIHFPGYPEQISNEYIEFPSELEMLREPMWHFAPAEHVMKHGTEFQKMLLNKAPLEHKCKYVYFTCVVRATVPGLLLNKVELPHLGSTRNEWHCDVLTHPKAKVHAITNAFGTEYNTIPGSIDIDTVDYHAFIEASQLALRSGELKFEAKGSPSNRFVTFDHHIHRAPIPDSRKVRYFIRINEMDSDMNTGKIGHKLERSVLYDGAKGIDNIYQYPNGNVHITF